MLYAQPPSIESQASLGTLQKLEILAILHAANIDPKAFLSILHIKSLKDISLYGTSEISKEFLESLVELPKLSKLTLDTKQIESLPDLKRISSLRTLSITKLYSSPASAEQLASVLIGFKQLESIYLNNLIFTEEQLETMVKSLPNLRYASMVNLHLPDSRLSAFQKSKVLHINAFSSSGDADTTFDDPTLQSLVPMKSLKAITLPSSSPVTEAGLADFKKARPDVKVTRK